MVQIFDMKASRSSLGENFDTISSYKFSSGRSQMCHKENCSSCERRVNFYRGIQPIQSSNESGSVPIQHDTSSDEISTHHDPSPPSESIELVSEEIPTRTVRKVLLLNIDDNQRTVQLTATS
eukprot:TRINITY_DN12917_c0_g1_i1.p1 TRINITY_DN12917_c0_g1~~TRINITY_DN12917_c0_g1_i1.p1  ORF type:complete len:122 (-),score=8.39 TRINITY_DN12917_c0_g1_i1:145-510(-)